MARRDKRPMIPVEIRREKGEMFVELNPDDILDLKGDDDIGRVTVTMGRAPLYILQRISHAVVVGDGDGQQKGN